MICERFFFIDLQIIIQLLSPELSPFPFRFSLTVWTAFRTCQSSVTSSCTTWMFLEFSFKLLAPSRSENRQPAKTVKPCLSRFRAKLCPKPLSQPKIQNTKETLISIKYHIKFVNVLMHIFSINICLQHKAVNPNMSSRLVNNFFKSKVIYGLLIKEI